MPGSSLLHEPVYPARSSWPLQGPPLLALEGQNGVHCLQARDRFTPSPDAEAPVPAPGTFSTGPRPRVSVPWPSLSFPLLHSAHGAVIHDLQVTGFLSPGNALFDCPPLHGPAQIQLSGGGQTLGEPVEWTLRSATDIAWKQHGFLVTTSPPCLVSSLFRFLSLPEAFSVPARPCRTAPPPSPEPIFAPLIMALSLSLLLCLQVLEVLAQGLRAVTL